jgi:hypothetical protein
VPYTGTKQPVLSILSMVAGLVGLLATPIGFLPIIGGIIALILPAAAVVLGFIGRTREPNARGFWLTGIITGLVGLALAVLSILLWSLFFATVPMNGYDYNFNY